MSLTTRATRAVCWTTGSQLIRQIVQVGLSLFLMRLLGPEAFGLIAMVLVFTQFADILSEMGFAAALIQRTELTESHRSTVFWLTIIAGVGLTALCVAIAPLTAHFYDSPIVEPLTIAIGFVFLLRAPSSVPKALLKRHLLFGRIVLIELAPLALSGSAAVLLAWHGWGVWSLVVQAWVAALLTSILALASVNWSPRFTFRIHALRDLIRFGAGLTGFNIVNYWARSADNLLIGRFMGATALGLYSRAYSLMLLPVNQIIGVLAPVMFPALSSIQEDKARVRRAYLRAMRLITLIAFPLMLGLLVVAEPFVHGLLGSEWSGVIPLTQILAVVGMTQSLCNPTGWIYTSQGRTDWMFWWGIGGSGTLIVAIIIGVLLGSVESVAWAYLIGNLIITFPCISIPGRLINLSAFDVFRTVSGNLACALTMLLLLILVRYALPIDLGPMVRLSILVISGISVFTATAFLCRLAAIVEIMELIRQFVPSLSPRLRKLIAAGHS